MTKVTYVSPDGTRTEVEAKDGDSVMHTAVANDIDGIIGECGGQMMCATCHCYVDDGWAETVGYRSEDESDLLDCTAFEAKETSRMSCQVKISSELEGLVIHLSESQI